MPDAPRLDPAPDASPAPDGAEEAIVAARRAKAAAVRARGEMPFANDLAPAPLADLGPLRDRFRDALGGDGRYDAAKVEAIAGAAGAEGDPGWVHVAGRVVAARSFGSARFLRLRDRTGEMQVYCRKDALGDSFARLSEVEVADVVEVEGSPMATRTGELSVQAGRVRLLTKALRPLPEKWHGLADVETRYRRRYVDLVANPEVAAVFRARSVLVTALRDFLDGEGFLEVETPSMSALVGGAAARPFETHHNALDLRLFLRIAPELYLKRLLVGGLDRVYEIARCYRNEGVSTRHNPEFTMLEFYQAYATYETLMATTERMLRFVDERLGRAMPAQAERWRAERPFALDEPFARVALLDAVRAALGRAGLGETTWRDVAGEGAPVASWAARSERAGRIDWGNWRNAARKAESDGERLFCAYEYAAEPFLGEDYRARAPGKSVPVFVVDYPIEVSPLARRKDADPSVVDRFELFVEGRELCNAFSELNDPDDQADRFRAQVARKARGDEEAMEYDEDYVRALEHGMPPAAGFGMGVDRLTMMLACQPSIRDVILFPLLRPEKGGR